MEFTDVLKKRKSIRSYLKKTVPKNEIESIIKQSLRVPTWGNIQPWELVVVGPEIVKEMAAEFAQKFTAGEIPNPDLTMPFSWPAKYKRRYVNVGRELFQIIGIDRKDKPARMKHYKNMYCFFGAPHAIFICMDKKLSSHYGPFDLGALSTGICLSATEKGLGTCIMACLCHYPDVVRKITGISDNMNIVIGITLGYPDFDVPANSLRTNRDEDVITWCGFQEE